MIDDEDDDDDYDDDDSEMGDFPNGAHLNFPEESQRYENFRYQQHSSSSRRTHQNEYQQAGPSRGRSRRGRNYGVVPFPRF